MASLGLVSLQITDGESYEAASSFVLAEGNSDYTLNSADQ